MPISSKNAPETAVAPTNPFIGLALTAPRMRKKLCAANIKNAFITGDDKTGKAIVAAAASALTDSPSAVIFLRFLRPLSNI